MALERIILLRQAAFICIGPSENASDSYFSDVENDPFCIEGYCSSEMIPPLCDEGGKAGLVFHRILSVNPSILLDLVPDLCFF